MKSKAELLQEQKQQKQEEFNNYVNKVNLTILKRFPNGLNILKVPTEFRLAYYGDFDIDWYTGFETELDKITKYTSAFVTMASELNKNGYEYLLNVHADHSGSRVKWFVDLYIK